MILAFTSASIKKNKLSRNEFFFVLHPWRSRLKLKINYNQNYKLKDWLPYLNDKVLMNLSFDKDLSVASQEHKISEEVLDILEP